VKLELVIGHPAFLVRPAGKNSWLSLVVYGMKGKTASNEISTADERRRANGQ
jgi:hypothetical protein